MKKNKASIISKRIQCGIGILFLLPPVFGVIAFMLNVFGIEGGIVSMANLSPAWTAKFDNVSGMHFDYDYYDNHYDSIIKCDDVAAAGAMSAAPLYLAIMAFVGVYLIKDNLKYLFTNED